MNTPQQYRTYRKPSWAPPSWLFGPVWTFLYILIAISFGNVLLMYFKHEIGFIILVPFILNIVFNAFYTPIQFCLKNQLLATVDIFLVLGTLLWALLAIYPYAAWVSYTNIPYTAWVCFATVLQVNILALNYHRS